MSGDAADTETEHTMTTNATSLTMDALLARWASDNTAPIPPARAESLALAITAGASDEALLAIVCAVRVSRRETIVLPAHKLEGLSRGKGWARQDRGSSAVWGERTDGGYRVGTGRWIVGGNDGFQRKGETTWVVRHIQVGDAVWTVAE